MLLRPLIALHSHVFAGTKLHADDTPLPVLAPGNAKPDAADDLWLLWSKELLEQYGGCAARHAKTVQASPK